MVFFYSIEAMNVFYYFNLFAALSAKEEALQWLNAVPGTNKAYSVVVGTSAAAILLGKEFVPFTAELVYVVPFSAVVAIFYKYLGPALKGVQEKVIQVQNRAIS
jgi:hypothetical protein